MIAFGTNGSFTYRPNSGYAGPDSFTYIVSNGTLSSSSATVNIQVGQVFGPRTNLDSINASDPLLSGGNVIVQSLTQGQSLVYNSNSAPRPIVAVDTSLRTGAVVPNSIDAQLTFGGIVGSTVTYTNLTGLTAGSSMRFALQVDASSLATGYYG